MTQLSWLVIAIVGTVVGFGLGFLTAAIIDSDYEEDEDEDV